MAIKIFPYLLALLAALLVVQTVSCEENERPDILFIENPDTNPTIMSAAEALLESPARSRRVCTAALCSAVCGALRYRYSYCNINKICVCLR